MINTYQIFVRKPKRKRPFTRYMSRWEDNTQLNLTNLCDGVDWTRLAQDWAK
jgi:hypothetical protein